MKKLLFGLTFLGMMGCQKSNPNESKLSEKTDKPNIIIFYVDDLGYGDIGVNGLKGAQTPEIDKLANGGVLFTDVHSPHATCTPSRYSMLTGEYAFRKKAQILPGDAPLLIDTNKKTLPDMLKEEGYKTAVVGKWHLGLGNGNVDWNKAVKPGPLEIGFDYSFLLPSTGDRVPSVYLENHNVVNLDPNDPITVSYKKNISDRPTGNDHPELLRQGADKQHGNTIINGISRIGYMKGGEKALWTDEDFPEKLAGKASDFIRKNKDNPFFLYFAFHDIHVPRLPSDQFKGKSAMGVRGDVILQMDYTTGLVMKTLKELGLEENTLVIFTSDNGAVLTDGYDDHAIELLGDHKPNGPFSGGKYSSFEGGTRVPMIAYWPKKIKAGQVNNATFSHIDFYASFADLLGKKLPEGIAKDSKNMLPALIGASQDGRDYMVEEGFTLAIRNHNWKYIQPIPKGKRIPNFMDRTKNIEGGMSHEPQLFNLEKDPQELTNLAKEYPEIVEQLQAKLDSIKAVEVL
ncbi:arylsulfatase [Flammeovirga sp. EKP202]|uniref:sulfatase family protein n=1 Tax=Flammeovirga sp. EKP202 TaxID=2770592 RepID=UPI00165F709D|nr:arylsulfatase [Flammeovirga sp. EKP202]MBD0404575.1 sulfatase-like hydrolase/transferase [Flammeovirga sp. EKP202]